MTAMLGVRFTSMGSPEEAARNTQMLICVTAAHEAISQGGLDLSRRLHCGGRGEPADGARDRRRSGLARGYRRRGRRPRSGERLEAAELIFAYERRRWTWDHAPCRWPRSSAEKVSRRSPRDIVLFKSLGTALEDIAVARVVYDKARAAGVGRNL